MKTLVALSDPNLQYLLDNTTLRKNLKVFVDENYELVTFKILNHEVIEDVDGDHICVYTTRNKLVCWKHSVKEIIGKRYYMCGQQITEDEWNAHPLRLRYKIKTLLGTDALH